MFTLYYKRWNDNLFKNEFANNVFVQKICITVQFPFPTSNTRTSSAFLQNIFIIEFRRVQDSTMKLARFIGSGIREYEYMSTERALCIIHLLPARFTLASIGNPYVRWTLSLGR